MVAGGTVYVGSADETLYAVDAATGSQEWAFTQPSGLVRSSPTVVADPESGNSVGSRVLLGTLGHHDHREDGLTGISTSDTNVYTGPGESDDESSVESTRGTDVYTGTGESTGASRDDSGGSPNPSFCPHCGTNLSGYPTAAYCPECGDRL